MTNTETNSRMMLYCICVNLLLWTFRTYATELPPDPDNAALLYYQAISLWSNLKSSYADANDVQDSTDDSDSKQSKSTLKFNAFDQAILKASTKEDEESRRNLMRRQTLDILDAASKIPRCSWGIYHSKGWGLFSIGPLRQLALLLDDDAQVLADEGNYRASLERCITMHRFAQHIGYENTTNYASALQVDCLAFRRILHTLESTPPDVETLLWLRNELSKSQIRPQWLVKTLRIDYARALQKLHSSPITVARIRNRLIGELSISGKKQAEDSLSKVEDEKLIPLIKEQSSSMFATFFESLNQVIEANETFTRTNEEIDLLIYKLRGNEAFDVFVPLYDLTHIMLTNRYYSIQTSLKAVTNATRVAIEIYLVKARTDKLPDVLPEGMPKDPFTGENFEYKKTEQGFILSFDRDHVSELRARQFEFNVQQIKNSTRGLLGDYRGRGL